MFKTILGLILATYVLPMSAHALPLPPANSATVMSFSPYFTTNYNFEGIVALSNCSGSIIRFENSKDDDNAMVLTNGHCFEGGFIDAGTYVINEPSSRSFGVMNANGDQVGRVRATLVLYGTMTGTDMAIYRLRETFKEILTKYNVRPLTLSPHQPTVGQNVEVISGYWERGYSCQIEALIYQLKEGEWTWTDSIRYSRPGCEVIGGTSGSPIVLAGSRTVIGVNNTGNESGRRCTDNNPCEIDKSGNISFQKGYSYGQQTFWVYSCLGGNRQLNVSTPGCMLPH